MLPLAIEPLSKTWFVVRGRRSHPDSPLKVAMIFAVVSLSLPLLQYLNTPSRRFIELRYAIKLT